MSCAASVDRHYGIIYITHFLEEVYELADRIVVLRDGSVAASGPAAEIPPERLGTSDGRPRIGGDDDRAAGLWPRMQPSC